MMRGRDIVHVVPLDDPTNQQPSTFRAHVSWESSEALNVNMTGGSSYLVVNRYIRVTYGPEHSIPAGSKVTWLGQEFVAIVDSPEEVHSGPDGRLHHKARQLQARGSGT